MASPKIWLITGASSGFGRQLTEIVLQNGDIAVATLRQPSVLSDLTALYAPSQLLVLRLDVTRPDEISTAFAAALRAFGRIDVVYNNAGYTLMSELEGTASAGGDDAARALFETNFWGVARMSREAVRIFREVNTPSGGRLLQVTSAGGVQGYASLGFYSASKFAIEGLTESLAAELRPEWNIKVTLIELGAFTTKQGPNMVRLPPHPAYVNPVMGAPTARAVLRAMTASDPAKACKVIYGLAGMSAPPLRIPLGKDALGIVKRKAEALRNAAEEYAAFSEGLEFNAQVEADRPRL